MVKDFNRWTTEVVKSLPLEIFEMRLSWANWSVFEAIPALQTWMILSKLIFPVISMKYTWTTIGPVLGSPGQKKKKGITEEISVNGHKNDEGTEASLLQGKAEWTGTVQTGQKKVLGDFITVYKYLKKDTKKIEPSYF